MRRRQRRRAWPFAALPAIGILAGGCGGGAASDETAAASSLPTAIASAMDELAAFDANAFETHVRVLAHDSLEGRAPGSRGFEGASRYVETHLRELGLEPAGTDGFRQAVRLQKNVVAEDASTLSIRYRGATSRYGYGEDFTLAPHPTTSDSHLRGRVVFVGFGVSAPDLGYDDYANVDVEGKVVAFLNGAPATLPNNPRAYYASAAVKREEAVRRGATGTISFADPGDRRFRWPATLAGARRGTVAWLDEDGRPNERGGAAPIAGAAILNRDATRALFRGAPVSLDEALANAAAGRAQAFELAVEVEMRTATHHDRFESHNLVAQLEGADASLRDEHVVYVAHLDHLGIGPPIRGDSIYNGAHDNASGTAILMEVARGFASLPRGPRRSVIFLFATAEEFGLLGSDYFVHQPTVPAESMVASIAIDMPYPLHPLLDVVPYGSEHSNLALPVSMAARVLGIDVERDPMPEESLFLRSDHYSFVRQGIPSLFIKGGFETGDDRDGEKIHEEFRLERYHTPFDEVDQGFDFTAGVTHARLNFITGYTVAMQSSRPEWNEGDFFGDLFGRKH